MNRILIAGGGAILVAAASVWLLPMRELAARAEGYVIVVDEPVRRVTVGPDQHLDVVFRFTNVTSHAVNVVGVETGCGCTSVEPIPVPIPSQGSVDVTCSFNMAGRAAGSTYHAEPQFFVDCPSPEIRVVVDLEL